MIETDYGYEVDIYDDTKVSVLVYNAILDIYNVDKKDEAYWHEQDCKSCSQRNSR